MTVKKQPFCVYSALTSFQTVKLKTCFTGGGALILFLFTLCCIYSVPASWFVRSHEDFTFCPRPRVNYGFLHVLSQTAVTQSISEKIIK